jgi:hypothetical protein
MRRRRLVWAGLAVLSVSALVFGTGGFGAAVADRNASIATSPHDRALVSIWDPGGASSEPPMYAGEEPVTPNDTRVTLLVVEHHLRGQRLDVSVTDRAGSPVSVVGNADGVEHGDVTPVVADVDCNGHHGRTEALLELRAVAEDGGFESVIDFDATVRCASPSTPAPTASPETKPSS